MLVVEVDEKRVSNKKELQAEVSYHYKWHGEAHIHYWGTNSVYTLPNIEDMLSAENGALSDWLVDGAWRAFKEQECTKAKAIKAIMDDIAHIEALDGTSYF